MGALSRLAARFGFESSVPVTMVDDWWQAPVERAIELAPRDSDVWGMVDEFGRIQVGDSRWGLDWLVAGGPRWVWPPRAERISQSTPTPGVVETIVTTPAGPVVQRVAAGLDSGRPVLVVEIENRGGVAVAVGIVARPLSLFGRGHVVTAQVGPAGIAVDGVGRVRFERPPGATAAALGTDGDLAQALPDPDAGATVRTAECRSGGAQVAAVWPLAHTATLRFTVDLDRAEPDGDVSESTGGFDPPTVHAIGQGWAAHLRAGMRVDVADTSVAERFGAATRTLLTTRPQARSLRAAAVAMAETGHSGDAARLLALMDSEDDSGNLAVWARWSQLADPLTQLDHLDVGLAQLARSAHVVAARPGALSGPPWLAPALTVLADRLRSIEQPDVADRMLELAGRAETGLAAPDPAALDLPMMDLMYSPAALRHVATARSGLVNDHSGGIDLVPAIPKAWRGRAIEVHGAPTGSGRVSFGIRWHGPRPALLWEIGDGTPLAGPITASGIDPDFSGTERSGEALLADPGWPKQGR